MKRICSHCRATFEWPVTLLPEEESLSKLSALIMGKLLLQGIDTGTEQRLYLGMLQ